MSASASAVASAPSRRMTGRVADRSSTVEARPAAAGPPSTRTAQLLRDLGRNLGERPRVGPAVQVGRRGEDRARLLDRAPRAPAGTPTRAIRCAADDRRTGGDSAPPGWARARSPRAPAARARAPRARARAARAAPRRPRAREHDRGGLRRIASLERTQPRARLRQPGVADQPVDGVRRDDGASALGERGDKRREVDARLGEVEAQRHGVRIPPGAGFIAGRYGQMTLAASVTVETLERASAPAPATRQSQAGLRRRPRARCRAGRV